MNKELTETDTIPDKDCMHSDNFTENKAANKQKKKIFLEI